MRREANELRTEANKTSSPEERRKMREQAVKLERECSQSKEPSAKALTGVRAIKRAEKALERAKWENENIRK